MVIRENDRRKRRWSIAAIALAIAIAGVIVMNSVPKFRVLQKPIAPFATVVFSVPNNRDVEFFDALRGFAVARHFDFTIKASEIFPKSHGVDILGEKLWMLGDNYYDPRVFTMSLYPVPGKRDTSENVDELVKQVTSSATAVPGVSAVRKK